FLKEVLIPITKLHSSLGKKAILPFSLPLSFPSPSSPFSLSLSLPFSSFLFSLSFSLKKRKKEKNNKIIYLCCILQSELIVKNKVNLHFTS
nr:antigen 7H8/5 - malaria parasite (Plasmodium falciparum) (fragments) [Plasmodium falciparum]